MNQFLIAISFILHLVAFLWITLLSIRVKQYKEIEKKQVEVQKEIEDLFQAYLLEMKEENEKLLNTIEKSANTNNRNIPMPEEKNYSKPNISQVDSTIKPSLKVKGIIAHQVYKTQKNSIPKPQNIEEQSNNDKKDSVPIVENQFEPSLNTQAILLHEKGYKPEEIARKLNKGKTEIELLLKFREQSK